MSGASAKGFTLPLNRFVASMGTRPGCCPVVLPGPAYAGCRDSRTQQFYVLRACRLAGIAGASHGQCDGCTPCKKWLR